MRSLKTPGARRRQLEPCRRSMGEESVADYLTKYKKACLGKKNQLRDVQDKLIQDNATGHEPAVCNFTCCKPETLSPNPRRETPKTAKAPN